MPKISFLELAEKVFQDTKKPMTPKEIWEKAEELGLTKELKSVGKTPIATLSARLSRHANLGKGGFKYASRNPATFFLKGEIDAEGDIAEIHETIFEFLLEKKEENPQLTFLLRTNNAHNRLDKGYWFWGNEEYVTISFWKGLDKKLSDRSIAFFITKDGSCSLALSATDSDNKALIFKSISMIIPDMKATKYQGKEANHWQKRYEGNNYLENLSDFFSKHKPIIDSILITSNPALLEDLGFIDEMEFAKSFDNIQRLRAELAKGNTENVVEQVEDNFLKLRSLSLKNVGLFQSIDITFGDRLTIFIGENGTGKTTLLRAIALGLVGASENKLVDTLDVSLQDLLRIERENNKERLLAQEGKIEIHYSLNSKQQDLQNTIWLKKASQATQIEIEDDAKSNFVSINGDNFPSLVIGFPQIHANEIPFFIRNIPFEKINTEGKPHIKDLLPILYNKSDRRFSAFSEWIVGLYNRENQLENGERKYLFIHKIFEIVSEVIGSKISFKTIRLKDASQKQDEVWIHDAARNQDIPLHLVSQGFNSIFGWLGYFMMRLQEANIDLADFTQAYAIVLLDEIDTYLHPKWQKNMLRVLVEMFPNTQFIVTTHSPLVASHLDAEKINMKSYLISPTTAIEIKTSGKDIRNVLHEAFGGIENRADFAREEIDNLYKLLNVEPLPVSDIEKKLAKLADKLGEYDPDIVSIQATLNFLQ